LADVVGEAGCGEASGKGGEEPSGFDLGELVVVADEYQLSFSLFDEAGDGGEVAGADHGGLVDHEDSAGPQSGGSLGLGEEAGDGVGGDAGGGLEFGGGAS
jgi:hypothetical protein